MSRVLIFIYGLLAYAAFFVVFLYMIGWVGGVGVPRAIGDGPAGPLWLALLVDLSLVLAFAAQTLLFLVTDRYFLPVIPLLAFAWWRGAVWINHQVREPIGSYLFIALFVLWVVPNVGKIVEMTVTQRQTPYQAQLSDGKYAPMLEIAPEIRQTVDKDAIVLASSDYMSELTFLARRLTVDHRGFRKLKRNNIDHHTRPLYVIKPAERGIHKLIDKKHWRIGPPLLTAGAGEHGPDWTLHRIQRPSRE